MVCYALIYTTYRGDGLLPTTPGTQIVIEGTDIIDHLVISENTNDGSLLTRSGLVTAFFFTDVVIRGSFMEFNTIVQSHSPIVLINAMFLSFKTRLSKIFLLLVKMLSY
jgi:hypothetical protein